MTRCSYNGKILLEGACEPRKKNMEGLSGMDLDKDGKPKVWKMIWLME